MTQNNIKQIHAAIGIIYNHDDSKILIAKRRREQIYAGYWELPGGKIESYEDATTAIVRELAEELDISVLGTEFIATVNFQYPNFLAKLEVFKINSYIGSIPENIGAEGQELFWLAINDIDSISPMLPASNQVLALLI